MAENIFKELQEIENKIKSQIDLDNIKNIREEIKVLEEKLSKLETIIDVEDIENQLWEHYRFATDADRKKAFFNLIEPQCDNSLNEWEHKISLINEIEVLMKEEIDNLKKLLDKVEIENKQAKKEIDERKEKIHFYKKKELDYNEKFTKSKNLKKITITLMMVFSLLLAMGSALFLHDIGVESDKMTENLKYNKFLKETDTNSRNIQNVNDEDEEDLGIESSQNDEEINSNENSNNQVVTNSSTETNNEPQFDVDTEKSFMDSAKEVIFSKYFLLSLIFLAVGKLGAVLYDKLLHPKKLFIGVLVSEFIIVVVLIFASIKVFSFTNNENAITTNYKEYIELKKNCSKEPFSWEDATDSNRYRNSFKCLAIAEIEGKEVYSSDEEAKKDFALVKKKAEFKLSQLDDIEDEKTMVEDSKDIFLRSYKKYKKIVDDYQNLKDDLNFYKNIQEALVFLAEMLFSSLAWMYLSELFITKEMKAHLALEMKKLQNEIDEFENSIKNNLILEDKTKEQLQVLNNYSTEIKAMSKGMYYDKSKIEEKKELMRKTLLSQGDFLLQKINASIIRKLAESK